MTVMIHGKAPEGMCNILYGASLTALKKNSGIRPIAVGNTPRRLASKIVSKKVGRSMEQLVRPEQVGYGTKGGTKAAVHAARCFVKDVQLKSCVTQARLQERIQHYPPACGTTARSRKFTRILPLLMADLQVSVKASVWFAHPRISQRRTAGRSTRLDAVSPRYTGAK